MEAEVDKLLHECRERFDENILRLIAAAYRRRIEPPRKCLAPEMVTAVPSYIFLSTNYTLAKFRFELLEIPKEITIKIFNQDEWLIDIRTVINNVASYEISDNPIIWKSPNSHISIIVFEKLKHIIVIALILFQRYGYYINLDENVVLDLIKIPRIITSLRKLIKMTDIKDFKKFARVANLSDIIKRFIVAI